MSIRKEWIPSPFLLVLGMCFVAAPARADTFEPCSPITKVNGAASLQEVNPQIVGNPGVNSGWILLYEGTTLSDEAFCAGGSIMFYASDPELSDKDPADTNGKFTANPDCTFGSGCTKVEESVTGVTKVVATSSIGGVDYTNTFTISSDPPEAAEPSALFLLSLLLLLGSGLMVLGGVARRLKQS